MLTSQIEAPPRAAGARLTYGSRGKIGMMLPSGNVAAEAQIAHMAPEGVSLHTTRLRLTGSTLEDLMGMTQGVEEAAALLVDAEVDVVAFHCTGVSTISEELEASILQRVASVAKGRRVTATSQAIVAALNALGARRIVMLTPYIAEINRREVAFLARRGFETLHEVGLDIAAARDMISVPPERWAALTRENARADADAYFISCTAVRSLEVVESLEAELGKPVVTSNQAMAWHAMRTIGVNDRLEGFGRLFDL
ncbi:MAG TPA: arylmalonate decarboxylase [Beijerinckiaceae bacterium]|jgi:maleate isomerase